LSSFHHREIRNFSSSSIKILKRNNTKRKTYDSSKNYRSQNVDNDKRMIKLLMEFKELYGDCHVPTGNSTLMKGERRTMNVSDELVSWVVEQRRRYKHRRYNAKSGKKLNAFVEDDDTWTHQKELMLESMGFIWSGREAQWQRFFNRLKQYGKDNDGNLQVKRSEDLQLYNWTDYQRKMYKRGELPSDKEDQLREIGFLFNPYEFTWWEYYERLCQYREKHGDTLVPTGEYEDDQGLSTWVARQRVYYHDGQLSDDRIKALNDIGFTWDAQRQSWDKYYIQLCEYYEQHNNTRVPRSMGPLWNWVDRQRRELRKLVDEKKSQSENISHASLDKGNLKKLLDLGILESDGKNSSAKENRAKRLMDLTLEVAVHEERWMKLWHQLRRFKEKYGHCSLPSEYKELSNWVRYQRYLYHSKKMPENRIALLDSINFAWTAKAARWNRMYKELMSFYQENGHVDVPATNAVLYRWTNQQKRSLLSQKKRKSNRLGADHGMVHELQELLLEKQS
jgi:hypothetical protein